MNKSTVIIGDFNTFKTVIDRQDKKKISKHKDLNRTFNQLDIIYSSEYSTLKQKNTCSSVNRILTNIHSNQHSYH